MGWLPGGVHAMLRYEAANPDVGGPLPHDGASSVEEVAALVGAFDDVSERGFGNLAGDACVGSLP